MLRAWLDQRIIFPTFHKWCGHSKIVLIRWHKVVSPVKFQAARGWILFHHLGYMLPICEFYLYGSHIGYMKNTPLGIYSCMYMIHNIKFTSHIYTKVYFWGLIVTLKHSICPYISKPHAYPLKFNKSYWTPMSLKCHSFICNYSMNLYDASKKS